jgi:hypothetical protein
MLALTYAQGPCAHDGLSARLIERAEFPFMFMVRVQPC